jgi:hypothetical protein
MSRLVHRADRQARTGARSGAGGRLSKGSGAAAAASSPSASSSSSSSCSSGIRALTTSGVAGSDCGTPDRSSCKDRLSRCLSDSCHHHDRPGQAHTGCGEGGRPATPRRACADAAPSCPGSWKTAAAPAPERPPQTSTCCTPTTMSALQSRRMLGLSHTRAHAYASLSSSPPRASRFTLRSWWVPRGRQPTAWGRGRGKSARTDQELGETALLLGRQGPGLGRGRGGRPPRGPRAWQHDGVGAAGGTGRQDCGVHLHRCGRRGWRQAVRRGGRPVPTPALPRPRIVPANANAAHVTWAAGPIFLIFLIFPHVIFSALFDWLDWCLPRF